MNTPPSLPSYFEDLKKVEIEENDDYVCHHCKKGVSGLVNTRGDPSGYYQLWREKDGAANSLFKHHE